MELKSSRMAIWILCSIILVLRDTRAACPKDKGRSLKPNNCSSSILDDVIKDYLQSSVMTLIIPAVYTLVLVLGLPANFIALWVLGFKTKKVPSTFLLINLAAADLLFLLALPFKITYHYFGNNWIFGEKPCGAVTAIFYGNMYASVLFLMAISIDRYIALVHPFSNKRLRGWGSSIGVSVGIWIVVAAGMSAFLIVPQTKTFKTPNITTCHDIWAFCCEFEWYKYYFLGLFTIGFAIPLAVILFCNVPVLVVIAKSREPPRHVIKIITLVLFTFILFFTPSNILLLLHYQKDQWESHNQLYFWYVIALSLSSMNSCTDPLIYYYMSGDFRTLVKATFCSSKGKDISSASTKSSKLYFSSDNKHSKRMDP
ncbi:hypothetical protein XENTR_v10008127 [Xenopus tropicalis]|uniref:Proteinase-activated receptor 3 n=1 Tax=Xenopus tropicalis TaxID=8364 RepID=A0A6I8SRA4_XENTR|nr:proteinase-activated receptor 3 isoform X2 [Xenopus tropicalis]KAE8614329.1 hypothetical protein XENTR_v10008127 [Xenopus tropicalis]|eukprot:XP_002933684.2 PREDICTED: proteinase-activated receptor 3-like isoform X2 [Xenopus tropicalis]